MTKPNTDKNPKHSIQHGAGAGAKHDLEAGAGSMELEQIAKKLNEAFDFPAQKIKASRGICDCISIKLSLDDPRTWVGGIYQNSRYFTALVFCSGRREVKNDSYHFDIGVNSTGVKLFQKNKATGEQVAKHIINQLSKLK